MRWNREKEKRENSNQRAVWGKRKAIGDRPLPAIALFTIPRVVSCPLLVHVFIKHLIFSNAPRRPTTFQVHFISSNQLLAIITKTLLLYNVLQPIARGSNRIAIQWGRWSRRLWSKWFRIHTLDNIRQIESRVGPSLSCMTWTLLSEVAHYRVGGRCRIY